MRANEVLGRGRSAVRNRFVIRVASTEANRLFVRRRNPRRPARFLENAARALPAMDSFEVNKILGTNLTFAGIQRGGERADVIAYLNSLSDNPAPLPKAAEAGGGAKQQ